LIDLPEHGQSAKPDVAYTQERFARAIDAVMRDAGVDRAVLVGHSMGGPVALTFLRLFPAKAKALVLVDAYVQQTPKDDAARANEAAMDAFAQRWHEPNYKESAAAMIESMFSDKTTPAMREEIRTKMLSTPQQVMASAFEGMFAIQPPKPGETICASGNGDNVPGAGRNQPRRAVSHAVSKFPHRLVERINGLNMKAHSLLMAATALTAAAALCQVSSKPSPTANSSQPY
jgi:pimeloyl-ACP methyl ester carboxylesterase